MCFLFGFNGVDVVDIRPRRCLQDRAFLSTIIALCRGTEKRTPMSPPMSMMETYPFRGKYSQSPVMTRAGMVKIGGALAYRLLHRLNGGLNYVVLDDV